MKKSMLGLGIADADAPDRHPDDYYGGPDESGATAALVAEFRRREMLPNAEWFWDPACGAGNIVLALRRLVDRPVSATDLHDRGWDGAATGIDFLKTDEISTPQGRALICNPPFRLAEEFIRKGWALKIPLAAWLLKATYFHAARRLALFRANPPRFIMPLTWRLDFTGQGAPLMECAWFVWAEGIPGSWRICEYVPLEKPKGVE